MDKSMKFTKARRAALAVALLAAGASTAPAAFTLEDGAVARRDAHADGFHAVLRFQEAAWTPPPAELDVLPPYVSDGLDPDGLDVAPTLPVRDLAESFAVTSALLATPGIYHAKAGDWTLAWEATLPDGRALVGSGDGVLSAQPARLGTQPAVQVLLDRKALARELGIDESGPYDVRVMVSGPPPDDAPARVAPIGHASAFERLARSVFLNAATLDEAPTAGPRSESRRALPAPFATHRIAYKSVSALGEPLGGEVLRVPLASLGTDAARAAALQLLWLGEPIALGGVLDGTHAWFYAPREHTPFDTHNAIFSTPASSSPSPAMATRPAFNTLEPEGTEVAQARSRVFDYNLVYERDAVLPPGQRTVWWQSRSNNSTRLRTRDLPVNDVLTSADIHVSAFILALNQILDVAPDHFADIGLQGLFLPRVSWNDRTTITVEGTITLPSLPNPASLTFTHSVPADSPLNGGADIQDMERVTLSWTGLPRLDPDGKGRLVLDEAPDGQPRRVTLGGLPAGTTAADVLLLDVTNPRAPVRLSSPVAFPDGSGTVALEWEAPATACSFHVQTVASVALPGSVTDFEAMPGLPEGMLTTIHVRPSQYASILAPLTTLRGPGAVALDPQAAYNAYNHGMKSPHAIKDALRDMLANAPERAPQPAVLMAGHASFDPRNSLNAHLSPKVPCFVELGTVEYGGSTREFPSDWEYGLLEGDDDFADIQLGRVMPRNNTDMQRAVDRYVAIEAAKETLRAQPRLGLVVTDHTQPSYFFFGVDAPYWQYLWELTGLGSIHHDAFAGSTSRPIIQGHLEGPDGGMSLVAYVGHGDFERWTSQTILNVADLRNSYNTDGKWPLFMAITCQNGLYAHPVLENRFCFADAVTLSLPTRGGLAHISSSTEESYEALRPVMIALLETLNTSAGQRPQTTGEFLTAGQVLHKTWYPSQTVNLRGVHMFGDPSASLALPGAAPGDQAWMVLAE